MAIVSGPQNAGLAGYSYKPPQPIKPIQPYGRLPDVIAGGVRPLAPQAAAPAPAAPVAPAAPPAPDFNALTLSDPQYTLGQNQLQQQNQINLEALLHGFRQQAQGYQDNANAHGALFSGAAVNAQKTAAQNYADQGRQQALNLSQGQGNLYRDVFNRLITQLAGGQ